MSAHESTGICEMSSCMETATHYVVIKNAAGVGRKELCRRHMELAHSFNQAKLTKIIEYGRLDKSWSVHPGGKS